MCIYIEHSRTARKAAHRYRRGTIELALHRPKTE
ncbi:hypothetical protein Avbf_15476 [Armadillidium vulgare]|nr:hypothetical protein Avbf_15476 [Armadillidium vulgare]